MTVIGRWRDEKAGCEVVSAEVHDRLMRESIGYVDSWRDQCLAAERQLQGAADEIKRLRGVIRDMGSLMPIVRRHAEQVTEWANEVLDPPTPGGQ